MDIQRGPLLNWPYFCQEKDMESLRQSLLLISMELENIRFKSEEELKMKDEQIIQLKYLLGKTIKERDESEDNCQRLNLEKLFLDQQIKQKSFDPLSGTSSNEDEPIKEIGSNNGFVSSDCEESIVSSPNLRLFSPPPLPPPPPQEEEEFPFLTNRALPEKGKLLEAVMNAGPLLQNLMLAGPLPQWRHPPPPLDTCQIPPPPLTIPSSPPPTNFLLQDSNYCGKISRKRGPFFDQESDTSNESKNQRLLLQ